MAVTKSLRYQILRRDNHSCQYCGASAPDAKLTVDHVMPTALGGTDVPTNLVTACRDCNAGKSATPADAALVASVQQDAMRWARAMHVATENAQVRREDRIRIERDICQITSAYSVPSYRGGGTVTDYLPGDYFVSIDQLLRAGLTDGDITDAVRIAAGARDVRPENVWRYACGVAWKKVKWLQEDARALIDDEDGPAEHSCHMPEYCLLKNEPDLTCPHCGADHCDWYCGYQEGIFKGWYDGWQRGHEREFHDNEIAIRNYATLSSVCDGRMVAEMTELAEQDEAGA